MILHVMVMEKFMPSFLDFMMANFDVSQHRFVFITSPKYQFGLQPHHPVEFLYRDEDFLTLVSYFDVADKIILHGLWRDKVNDLLVQNKDWLDKSFWTMWGGDFYYYDQYSYNHKKVITEVAGLISFIPGDIEWVRQKYEARGQSFSCFCYPSNIYGGPECDPRGERAESPQTVNILLGHSSAVENNHIYWIEYFSNIHNAAIFSPLAYPPNPDYINKVVAVGHAKLKERFNPLLEFSAREHYELFLNNIDLAIMPSWRQHGMGNLISLLGRGIPVAMHSETTSRKFLQALGVELFSTVQIDVALANIGYNAQNAKIIQRYFSHTQLINDWRTIFNR
ncbi:TDP-N-acetylfucosamine:lipid II N-acetylfucosaminyltransferase [Aeromonas veronii]|uniref:TDP-N-acetylfucosamine:lipid II N-acetylfucosaminyltransferase n=1 Tax=Aeromonas veronii TaxID=654 RepID=UPI0038E66120